MKTLHLVLKKRWFDMILSGEKKEEYREIKPDHTDGVYPAIYIGDVTHTDGLIGFYITGVKFDVYNLAFIEFVG